MSDPKQIATKMTSRQLVSKMRRLKEDFQDAFESLSGAAGQASDELVELQETLWKLADTTEQKIANTVQFIDHIDEIRYALEGQADYHADRLRSIQSRVSALQNSREKLKDNIREMMEVIEETKVRVDDRTIFIQEYERLDISELSDDDKKFLIEQGYGEERTNLYIDKKKMKDALDSDEELIKDYGILGRIKLEKTKSLRGI